MDIIRRYRANLEAKKLRYKISISFYKESFFDKQNKMTILNYLFVNNNFTECKTLSVITNRNNNCINSYTGLKVDKRGYIYTFETDYTKLNLIKEKILFDMAINNLKPKLKKARNPIKKNIGNKVYNEII